LKKPYLGFEGQGWVGEGIEQSEVVQNISPHGKGIGTAKQKKKKRKTGEGEKQNALTALGRQKKEKHNTKGGRQSEFPATEGFKWGGKGGNMFCSSVVRRPSSFLLNREKGGNTGQRERLGGEVILKKGKENKGGKNG